MSGLVTHRMNNLLMGTIFLIKVKVPYLLQQEAKTVPLPGAALN